MTPLRNQLGRSRSTRWGLKILSRADAVSFTPTKPVDNAVFKVSRLTPNLDHGWPVTFGLPPAKSALTDVEKFGDLIFRQDARKRIVVFRHWITFRHCRASALAFEGEQQRKHKT